MSGSFHQGGLRMAGRLLPALLVAGLATLIWLIWGPALMSQDSLAHYENALTGKFNAVWHPVLLPAVVHLVLIAGGTLSTVTFLQCLIGLGGLLALSRAISRSGSLTTLPRGYDTGVGLATVAVLASPLTPLSMYLMTLWKDTWIAILLPWYMVTALALRSAASRSHLARRATAAALLALSVAITALRHNSMALLPVLAAIAFLAAHRTSRKWAWMLAIATLTAGPLCKHGLTRALQAPTGHPYSQVMLLELAGLCVESDAACSTLPLVSAHLDLRLARQRFEPGSYGALAWQTPVAVDTSVLDSFDALASEYWSAARRYPGSILSLKLRAFVNGLGVRRTTLYHFDGIAPNPFGLVPNVRFERERARLTMLADALVQHRLLRWISGVHLPWLLATVGLAVGLLWSRGAGCDDRRFLAALLLLPLAYYLSYLPALPVPEHRLMFPATLVAQCWVVSLALGRLLGVARHRLSRPHAAVPVAVPAAVPVPDPSTSAGGGEEGLAWRLKRAQAWLLAAVVSGVGLLAAVSILVAQRSSNGFALGAELRHSGVQAAVVEQLVAQSSAIWDTFPDPDVGRLLQPGLDGREAWGKPLSSNAFGWREGPVEIPKPAGTVRIVLLGDSFVFGPGIDADDRMGELLERYLLERAGRRPARLEALHIGMSSWNIRAESQYLRRNLSNLGPDLVVQIAVSNDLDDSGTARGFGVVADFTSQRPEQTSTIHDFFPIAAFGFKQPSLLNAGLGYEARRRYQDNAVWLAGLDRAVRAAGGEYLLLMSWADQPQVAARYLPALLPPRATVYLSDAFRADPRYRIGPSDPHWSPAGNAQLARILYGAILDRRLLSELELGPWREAEDAFREVDGEGRREARLGEELDPSAWEEKVESAIDLRQMTEKVSRQVYGGVGADGLVGPYAALLLRRGSGTSIRIEGAALAAPELTGTEVEVYVDEHAVGRLPLVAGRSFAATYPLPEPVRQRRFFDLQLRARDWVYTGPNLRRCVVFRLERALVSS